MFSVCKANERIKLHARACSNCRQKVLSPLADGRNSVADKSAQLFFASLLLHALACSLILSSAKPTFSKKLFENSKLRDLFYVFERRLNGWREFSLIFILI